MATTRMILTRSLFTTKRTLSSLLSRSSVVSLSAPPPSPLISPPPSPFSARSSPSPPTSADYLRRPPRAATRPGERLRLSTIRTSLPGDDAARRLQFRLRPCKEHWLVVLEEPEADPTRDEIIDSYIKTPAEVVGRFDFLFLSPSR
ncbi:multiple organellar RNA editing factor 8, chloroplastic/mitochondrial-like [Rhododendron vialii]|uniref:multiple organellar RNA editing factor 8, chloroplastic/mitochondrial-like n=1 Tax=Rhododendron vialii TaxID=182163 RepID=UPI00265DED9F|nr:multiple organellar RNA editing factor 8, chloroplastic/mitochondrial-like [Rhododendron vialii]